MKMRIFITVLVLLLSVAAFAQEKPPMDIPVYPGGEPGMEINLSNEDILPMVKAMFPLFAGKLGAAAEKLSPEDIALIFKDMKRIQVLQLDVAKAGVSETDISTFYNKNLPSGSWTRVFWQSAPTVGTVAVYAQGGEGLYGFRIRTVSEEGKPVKRVEILKTEGKVDFAKLISLASKFIQ